MMSAYQFNSESLRQTSGIVKSKSEVPQTAAAGGSVVCVCEREREKGAPDTQK